MGCKCQDHGDCVLELAWLSYYYWRSLHKGFISPTLAAKYLMFSNIIHGGNILQSKCSKVDTRDEN